jgi:asparagine synthase (glutamine-hydrolysing)
MPYRMDEALQRLKHRGPDHVGRWVSQDGRVGLGHTRLAILDLAETGNQPMANANHTVRAVVNGEIYDWEKQRAQLKAHGCQFRSNSDSEVALQLYLQHGISSMVSQLRGEFAIAINDERQGIFHAVRDRFGIKPLLYARHGGRWLFASEAKALFALGVPARWSIDHVTSYSHMWGGSCFAGISSVPPGHYATVTHDGQLRLTRYWDSEYPDRNVPDLRTDHEMIEGVRSRLLDSVRVRLRSDVPVGVYLSGGVDSCTALGMAAHLSPKSLSAFTLSFSQHDRFDEAKSAELQAKKSGAQFHRIQISADDLADSLEGSLYHCEQAMFNLSGVAKFRLSKFVRDHGFKVVLTGEGSDEIFAGYQPMREDLARYGKGIDEKDRQAIIDSLKKGNLWLDSSVTLTTEQCAMLESTVGFVPTWFRNFPPHVLQDVLSDEVRHHIGPHRDQLQYVLTKFDARQLHQMKHRWDVVHSSLYLENHTLLPSMLLTVLGDRNEMAHSIEGRVPFLDHPLVEYVNNLPPHVKIRGTQEKWILREAARPFITDDAYARIKHPFLAPPSFLDPTSKLHDLVQTTLRSPSLQDLWWIDQSKVIEQLDALTQLVQANNAASMTQQQRELFYAKLLTADAKFLSIVSFAILQDLFQVE